MLKNLFVALVSGSMLVACGASPKNKEDVTPLEPSTPPATKTAEQPEAPAAEDKLATSLPLSGLAHASLREYAVESRCDALIAGVKSFFAAHAADVTAENFRCSNETKHLAYSVVFDLVKGDTRILNTISLREMNADRPQYYFINRDGAVGNDTIFDVNLAKFNTALGNFHKSMVDFVGAGTLNQTIFGISYASFIDTIDQAARDGKIHFNVNGQELEKFKFKLNRRVNADGRIGSVEFIEVPESLLSADNSWILGFKGLLGCKTLECLNDGKVTYEFEEQLLVLSRVAENNITITMRRHFDKLPGSDD